MASDDGGNVVDVERAGLQGSVAGVEFPAVAEGFGDDLSEVPDLEAHAGDESSVGVVFDGGGDRSADGKFVHGGS